MRNVKLALVLLLAPPSPVPEDPPMPADPPAPPMPADPPPGPHVHAPSPPWPPKVRGWIGGLRFVDVTAGEHSSVPTYAPL